MLSLIFFPLLHIQCSLCTCSSGFANKIFLLHNDPDEKERVLDWEERLQIALDISHGIEYLHEGVCLLTLALLFLINGVFGSLMKKFCAGSPTCHTS